jgi:hypothetical protein
MTDDVLSIAPETDTVTIGKGQIEVHGISNRVAVQILRRFPVLLSLLGEQGANMTQLLEAVPDAGTAIMAAGVRKYGDAKAEETLDALPMVHQFDLIEAILRLTMPGGVGPFVERLTRLMNPTSAASREVSEEQTAGELKSSFPLTPQTPAPAAT